MSVLNVLNLAELGIGSALVFSMYKPVEEDDRTRLSALLALYRRCYRVIGAVILTVGLLLMPFLPYLIEGTYPSDVNLYLLYGIYLANTVVSYFLFAYKQSLFIASQRNDWISNINSALLIVTTLLQVFFLICFGSYYLYVLVLPMVTCINNIAICILFRKKFPWARSVGTLDKETLKTIKTNVIGLMTQKIGTVVLSSASSVIISAFLGLVILGKYNNYYYIITALFGFLTIVQTSIIPSIGNSIITTSKEKNYTDFRCFLFLYVWILSWFAVCFLVLSESFVSLWVGKSNVLSLDVVVLMSLFMYAYKMNDMTYVFREATGIWYQGMFIPIIAALVNIGLSLTLVNYWGLLGVLFSGIASLLLVYTPWYSRVLFKYYFDDMSKWKAYLLTQGKYFLVTLGAAIVTFAAASLIPTDCTMTTLLLKALVALFIPNLLFMLVYHRSKEFISAKALIESIIRKRRGNK